MMAVVLFSLRSLERLKRKTYISVYLQNEPSIDQLTGDSMQISSEASADKLDDLLDHTWALTSWKSLWQPRSTAAKDAGACMGLTKVITGKHASHKIPLTEGFAMSTVEFRAIIQGNSQNSSPFYQLFL
jgi:hypothetical protein